MRPARFVLIALLSGAGCCTAQAQAIYRCGDSYSQQPCAGGRQLEPGAPPPSAADRSQAAEQVSRDARLAETLERDRLRREALASQASAVLPPPDLQELEPYKPPEKASTRKQDMFTASVPGSRRPRARSAARKQASAKSTGTPATRKSGSASGGSGQSRKLQPPNTAATPAART